MSDWPVQLSIVDIVSTKYVFSPIQPGVNLTGSTPVTITLSPVPLGINGTNTDHYLYISGGTGTAEAVLITGGTAVSGASSGTITFTPANSHSGLWTIQSATAGIQEAIWANAVAGQGISVRLPIGPALTLYAGITIAANFKVSLRGAGMGHSVLQTHGLTGDWITYKAGSFGYVDIGDFTLQDDTSTSHTSGTMLRLFTRGFGNISNLEIVNGWDALLLDYSTGFISINGCHLSGARYGLHSTGVQTQLNVANCNIHGGVNGILIDATTSVGVYIANNLVDSSGPDASATSAAISLHSSAANPINEVVLTGNDFESQGIGVECIGSTRYLNNNLVITGGRISSLQYGVKLTGQWNATKIGSLYISTASGGVTSIYLADVDNVTIDSCTILAQNLTNAITIAGTVSSNIAITNNVIGAPGWTVNCTNGINITNVDRILIANNYIVAGTANLVQGAGVTNLIHLDPTNRTGSGALVLATSPALVTPDIGVATGARLGLGAAADATYLLNLNSALIHGISGNIGINTTTPTTSNGSIGRLLEIAAASNANSAIVISSQAISASSLGAIIEARLTQGGVVGDRRIGQLHWLRLTDVTSGKISSYTELYINNDGTLTRAFQVSATNVFGIGNGLELTIVTGKINKYNNIATVGQGIPSIYGSGRSTAQTAAVASVAAYTNGAADGTFIISANVNVTTATTHNFTVTVTYTDETNTSRTLTLSFFALAGGAPISSITNITGAGPYEGAPVHIRVKASTAITIATVGTFTTVTYNVEGYITQIG